MIKDYLSGASDAELKEELSRRVEERNQHKMFDFNKEDEKLFKDVVFLVECTHNETYMFWKQFHNNPTPGDSFIRSWVDEGIGQGITIGTVDNRPICITIFWAKLNGKRVLFYEGTSQLVDHKMIDDWIKHFTLKTIRWDGGTRWAHCDSSNFHHCLNALDIKDTYKQ